MKHSTKRQIWSAPWSYPEGWIVMGALLLLGILWQWIFGPIPRERYAFPINLIYAGFVTIFSILVGICSTRLHPSAGVRFLVSPAATITVLTAFLVQLIAMGFLHQMTPVEVSSLRGFIHSMGWSSIVHSYPFNLTYLYLLLILGSVTVRKIIKGRKNLRWFGFVFNHLGLYLFLLFALLSGTDMKRFTMVLEEGSVEWRGMPYGSTELVELPIAIQLEDFHMDEYPPKLMLLDGKTGEVLPLRTPQHILVEDKGIVGDLSGWDIKVHEVLPLSAPVMNGDSILFTLFGSSGAAPAVKLTATKGNESYTGWVSAGSYLFPFRALGLSDDLSIVMPTLEPKQYYSQVEYFLPTGETGETTIAVNHPLKVNNWYVYQLNYDTEKGQWSTMSELELVWDPWLWGVYSGIGMLCLGAIFLLLGPAHVPYKKEEV